MPRFSKFGVDSTAHRISEGGYGIIGLKGKKRRGLSGNMKGAVIRWTKLVLMVGRFFFSVGMGPIG